MLHVEHAFRELVPELRIFPLTLKSTRQIHIFGHPIIGITMHPRNLSAVKYAKLERETMRQGVADRPARNLPIMESCLCERGWCQQLYWRAKSKRAKTCEHAGWCQGETPAQCGSLKITCATQTRLKSGQKGHNYNPPLAICSFTHEHTYSDVPAVESAWCVEGLGLSARCADAGSLE